MIEDQHIEWKTVWRDEFIKWISGFANADGGRLEIGKNDKREIIGVENANQLMELLPNKVRDTLGIVVDAQSHDANGLIWLSIDVDSYSFPVSYKGQYHYRTGSTKQELKGTSLNHFLLRKQGKNWDSVPRPYVQISDLGKGAMRLFGEKAIARKRLEPEVLFLSPRRLLSKLKLLDGDYITNAGVLLFHPDPGNFYSGANVKIGFFSSPSDVLYHDVIDGPIIAQVDKVMDLLTTKYLKAYIRYERVERMEEYLFPEAALREAVVNAIVHKDYSSGVPIQIRVYEDRVVIWNPGDLPQNWSVKDLTSDHRSIPFNPAIAETFFRAGFVESWGRGIDTIVNLSLEYGNDAPSFSNDLGGLEVVFSSKKLVDYLPEKYKQEGKSAVKSAVKDAVKSAVKDAEKIVLKINSQPKTTVKDLAKYLNLSLRATENRISGLKSEGRIKRVGSSRGGYWEVIN